MLKQSVDRIVSIGVIEHANDPQRGSLSFDQPKTKMNWVNFLSDLRNLNMQLNCKTYLMPT